jgi:hypothetical protein
MKVENVSFEVKEKAITVAEEIVISSMRNNDKIFMDKKYAQEYAESLEIIYNKVLDLLNK